MNYKENDTHFTDAVSAHGRLVHAAAQAVDVAAVPGYDACKAAGRGKDECQWNEVAAYCSSAEQMSSLKSSITTKSGKCGRISSIFRQSLSFIISMAGLMLLCSPIANKAIFSHNVFLSTSSKTNKT